MLDAIVPRPDYDGILSPLAYTLDDICSVHPTVLWQVEKMFKKEGRVRDLILLSQMFFLVGQKKLELRGGRAPRGTSESHHKKKEAAGIASTGSAVAGGSGASGSIAEESRQAGGSREDEGGSAVGEEGKVSADI